jgi:DNA-binding response OmpR family regulator
MTTIMVIETDRLLRCAIAVYLKRQKYGVLEATDAQSARECLERENVQAILLDTHPEEQSLNLLKHIRSRPSLAQVPIIALITANGLLEALDYLKPGDYLRIPFDMKHLDWLLQKLLARPTLAQPSLPNLSQPPAGPAALSEQGSSPPPGVPPFGPAGQDEAPNGA